MSRIEATFDRLRREKAKALVAYLTVGFPSVKALAGLAKILAEEGVDLLELGIPFSDPLADGPTIQAASQWALRQGVTPRLVLKAVEGLRRRGLKLPVALLTYYNPIYQYGLKRFCRDSTNSGADGLIVPDLPPEEAQGLIQAARPAGIDTIFLASPTSPPSRLARIAELSSGFIYYVSLTGVTGARRRLPPEVAGHVRSIRRFTSLPICVGFGVSRPEQVKALTRVADGVIVGSALLDAIGKSARNDKSPVRAAAAFLRPLRRACRHPALEPLTPEYFRKVAGILGTGGKALKALLEEKKREREL